ncbi:hypothetical protein ACFL0W_06700 [Nanoarchaeota archaeon]
MGEELYVIVGEEGLDDYVTYLEGDIIVPVSNSDIAFEAFRVVEELGRIKQEKSYVTNPGQCCEMLPGDLPTDPDGIRLYVCGTPMESCEKQLKVLISSGYKNSELYMPGCFDANGSNKQKQKPAELTSEPQF